MVSFPVPSLRRKALTAGLLALLGLLAAALLLSLAFAALMGSERFLDRLEEYLSGKAGRPVEVGSLRYAGDGRFLARDVRVGTGDPPSVLLPLVELRATVPGLLKARVNEVLLDRPEILVGTPGEGPAARVFAPPPVDRVVVRGGTVRLRAEGGEDVAFGPFSASFETVSGGEILLEGQTALPFLESPLSFRARLDPSRLSFSGGELAAGEVSISPLARGYPLEGTADLRARIISAGGGEAEFDLRADLRDVSLALGGEGRRSYAGEFESRIRLSHAYRMVGSSGTLNLRGGGSPGEVHVVRYDGSYDREAETLKVRSLRLASPRLGGIAASGSASSVAAPRPSWQFDLRTDGLRVPALLAALGAAGEALPLRATLESELTARGEGSTVFAVSGEARCADLRVRSGSPLAFLGGRPLQAAVSLTASGGSRWELERFELAVGELPPFRLRGRLIGRGGPQASVEGVLELPRMPAAAVMDLLGEQLPARVRDLDADGEVEATVNILGPPGHLHVSATASLQGERLAYGDLRVSPFSARGSFRYSRSAGEQKPAFAGSVILKGQRLEHGALSLSPFSADMSFRHERPERAREPVLAGSASLQGRRLEHGVLRVSSFSAGGTFSNGLQGPLSGRFRVDTGSTELHRGNSSPLALGSVSLEGPYVFDPSSTDLKVAGGILRPPGIPDISLSGRLSLAPEPSLDLELGLPAADVAPLSPRLAAALPHLEGFALSGRGRLGTTLALRPRAGGGYMVRGRIDGGLEGGAFSSADGSRAAEGISARTSASLDLTVPEGEGTVAAEGRASGFELLVGRFYGNFAERGIGFRLSGRIGGDALFTVEKLEAGIEGLGEAAFHGAASGGREGFRATGRLSAAIPSHRGFFDFFLRDTFKERFPWLTGLEPEGRSRATADFSYRPDEGLSLAGSLRAEGTALRSAEAGFVLRGLDLELPLRVSTARKGPGDGAKPTFGTLRWEEISWRGIRLPAGEAAPSVFDGDLLFRGDIDLPLLDGRLLLGDVACLDLMGPRRTIRLSAEARGLRLEPLLGALGLPPVAGTLDGRLHPLTYREGELLSEGELTASVFGGTVRVENLSAGRLLSPVPSLGLSLSLSEIRLAEVTGALDFGHISGVLEGSVRDMIIVAGEPQAFEARLESVKRPGVEQRISVEALEKISILGSGGGARILSRGIYRFFKEYRYDKMGFSASLRNDRLRLSGVHQEGDRTYLVRGGILPPKADVIAHSQVISFRDMAERLRRITRIRKQEGGDR